MSAYAGMREAIVTVREENPGNVSTYDSRELKEQLEKVKKLERELRFEEGHAFDFVDPNLSNEYKEIWMEGKNTGVQRRTGDDARKATEKWQGE